MSSLTQTAHIGRISIKYGSIGLIIFVILWSSITTAIKNYQKNKLENTPDVRYGKLPAIIFPQKDFQTKTFSLELPKETFPKTPAVSKVFVVFRPVSTLLALEQDAQTAKKMGFTGKPVEIRTAVYQFSKPNSEQILTMNVMDGSFNLSYPYKDDQLLITSKNLPEKNQAISIAKSFLDSADKIHPDLDSGNQIVSYWSISSQGIKKVNSFSEANAIKVDFARQKIDDIYPIVSSNPDAPPISVLISASTVETKRIIEVNYKYAPVDNESFSRYPIISAEQAYSLLTKGDYWPARDSQTNQVVIKNIYLAYYEPTTLTNFMQPIYVFEGSDNFIGYVSAITSNYISRQ